MALVDFPPNVVTFYRQKVCLASPLPWQRTMMALPILKLVCITTTKNHAVHMTMKGTVITMRSDALHICTFELATVLMSNLNVGQLLQMDTLLLLVLWFTPSNFPFVTIVPRSNVWDIFYNFYKKSCYFETRFEFLFFISLTKKYETRLTKTWFYNHAKIINDVSNGFI